MSSILKALKKIDASSPPDDNGAPWPYPADTRDAITRSIKRRWLIRRMTTYILVAACLISLAVLLYFRQLDRASQARTAENRAGTKAQQGPIHRAKIATTAPGDRPAQAAVPSQSTPPGASTPPQTKRRPDDRSPALGRTPALPTEDVSRDTVRGAQTAEPLPKTSMKAATRVTPPAGGKTKLPAARGEDTTGSTAPTPAEKPTQYSRLQDTGLVLQAIAWAPEPSRRIAVVNGSIVKEGDSVEGYTLMRIRKDDIVLNNGGRTWQLEFGLQH